MKEGSYFRVNAEFEHEGCPIGETTKLIRKIEIDSFPYRLGRIYRDTIIIVTSTENHPIEEMANEVIKALKNPKNESVVKSLKVLRETSNQLVLHASIYDQKSTGLIRIFYETMGLITVPSVPVHSSAGIERYTYWASSEQLALDSKQTLSRDAKLVSISKPIKVRLPDDLLDHSTLFSQIFCDALESDKVTIQELQKRAMIGLNLYDETQSLKIDKPKIEEMFSRESIVKTAVPVLVGMLQSHLMNPDTERWITDQLKGLFGIP